ncbi:MAG: hypothetical protein ACRDZT_07975, partial [Acidimicrobiales bacterium]
SGPGPWRGYRARGQTKDGRNLAAQLTSQWEEPEQVLVDVEQRTISGASAEADRPEPLASQAPQAGVRWSGSRRRLAPSRKQSSWR